MKLNKKNNSKLLFIFFFIIFLYHFFIQNGIEKIFTQTYFPYHFVKRPFKKCKNPLFKPVKCVGLPSGHAETVTILCSLLYYYKIIPLYLCIFIILIITLQRVVSYNHTFFQVIVGIMFGLIYSCIYIYFNLSFYAFLCVFFIGFIFAMLTINKIDRQVYGPMPEWVDKQMLPSIYKKQNTLYINKVYSILLNSVLQQTTFISWTELEEYLDILIERIKASKINFDGVVGIKTGGAIISDYISSKLNIPNYKVKVSKTGNNCNKNYIDGINECYDKILKSSLSFDICEEIKHDLTGKNIILIDELISTGHTMKNTIDYLKYKKKTNIVYPTCIAINDWLFKYDFEFVYVFSDLVVVWPWGYDN